MNAKLKAVLKGIGASILLVAVKGATDAAIKYLESLIPVASAQADAAIRAIIPVQKEKCVDNESAKAAE